MTPQSCADTNNKRSRSVFSRKWSTDMNGYLNFPADSQIFSTDSGSWHEPDESKSQTQEILFYFLLDLKVFRVCEVFLLKRKVNNNSLVFISWSYEDSNIPDKYSLKHISSPPPCNACNSEHNNSINLKEIRWFWVRWEALIDFFWPVTLIIGCICQIKIWKTKMIQCTGTKGELMEKIKSST